MGICVMLLCKRYTLLMFASNFKCFKFVKRKVFNKLVCWHKGGFKIYHVKLLISKRTSPGNYRKGSSKFKKGIYDFAPFIITPDATSSTLEKAVKLPE
ncbi:hypothetical protein GGTG_02483 [Gaeumannomyces tritici R3-111a-1]|uniref:Uncharacterized protein n=1 Tax=Gaeumannomyces tritici (strain R3-111a-1) TaxID=644352 RepID=J3NMH7_GAET3|nr:hypothetical protein GGTG_02483 [Gaeumannomyces tritici R3-111a-1]EJT82510.1 hypothetical protein GGTG_02483 [Gaeumannomyces tritici R3-111a-1]